MKRGRLALTATAVVLVLGAILVLSQAREDTYGRPPLDPRGTGPEGTAALVALLRAEGAEVRLGGQPSDDDDVVLQLADRISGEPARRLRDWVADGGTLVVADPFAALAPRTERAVDTTRLPGTCTLRALADLGDVGVDLPTTFRTRPSTSGCFTATVEGTTLAAVDVRREGRGLVAAVSTTAPFQNQALDGGDASVLAVSLLDARPGTRIRVLDPIRTLGDTEDVGDGTILGALPARGRQAVYQLALAFLAWGLIRGRRLGRPVTEELPVPLPASDLVLAAGRLLDRNGDAADAAEHLRRRARRDLGLALGLGSDPPPPELADALVARAGADPRRVTAALLAPVVDEDGLVTTAAHLDTLRRELHR